jgi:hypothetical protein
MSSAHLPANLVPRSYFPCFPVLHGDISAFPNIFGSPSLHLRLLPSQEPSRLWVRFALPSPLRQGFAEKHYSPQYGSTATARAWRPLLGPQPNPHSKAVYRKLGQGQEGARPTVGRASNKQQAGEGTKCHYSWRRPAA